jgi:hypothetical protein
MLKRIGLAVMNSKKITPKKNKAQAMVEFAIALPILLMLLYGILEVGRLLFTYSSVVNATRQAVRWGSTTGMGDGGNPGTNSGIPRYQDCAGIRASAQRGDYLDVFEDGDITITYDMGPGVANTLPDTECDGSSDTGIVLPTGSDANKGRIIVSIDYDFKAIIPKLVPFVSRTINATSARTIITSISIGGSSSLPPKETTITTITLDDPDPSEVGQPVNVIVTVTGATTTPTGTVDITGADSNCTITLSSGTGNCLVTFTSTGSKTITATYIGDSTHNGSSDTEPHTVILAATITTITSDTPDPSNVNGTANVNVMVTSVWAGFPTGTVSITGADSNCTITLSSSGTGNCLVTFTSTGSKTITATYNGDATHAGSFDTEPHTVVTPTAGPSPTSTRTLTPGPTSTRTLTPSPVPPSCSVNYTVTSQWSNGFNADVVITNTGSTEINGWTLSFNFTGGQTINNLWNANYTQNGAAVTATSTWNGTINANGGSQSFGFSAAKSDNSPNPPPASFSLNGVLCSGGVMPPTATLTPSLTPTTIPTGVSCTQITHGNPALSFSGVTMSMDINNQTGVALAVQNITVTWNHDRGRTGNPSNPNGRPLALDSADLDSNIFWTANQNGPSATLIPSPAINIPVGTSKISIKFNWNYANLDGTERIYINFSTPGCGFLDSNN